MNCRHCQSLLEHVFLDLGAAPPSNAYLTENNLTMPEVTFPLRLFVCTQCWLVQTEDYAKADELFCTDYAYFSSVSKSWLLHASRYCDMIEQKMSLNANSFVIEVASNDGYLLKNFVKKGIPCLGIEPTNSTADAAEKLNVPVLREFFCETLASKLAKEGKYADLIIGNNVYAHVPDINDFTQGLREILKPQGIITLEFPHLMRLIEFSQFDTVYHEHFSYLSLSTVAKIFKSADLRIFDVEELPTHGGSLRVYGCRNQSNYEESSAVAALVAEETKRGMSSIEGYKSLQYKAESIKDDLLLFLLEQRRLRKSVIAYGAAAKGNTLLNFAGIRQDLLPFVCDSARTKQGKYLPGSRIPILAPDMIMNSRPDYMLILPWNLSEEICSDFQVIRSWNGKFVTAIPAMKVL